MVGAAALAIALQEGSVGIGTIAVSELSRGVLL
jgi:hypothetical protein